MTEAAIQAFVGTNGGGKTLAMVERCVLPAVAEGRVIVGNLRLAVPDFRLLRDWRELVRLGVHSERGVPCLLGPRGERLSVNDGDAFDRARESGAVLYSLTQNRPALLVLDEITACLPSRSFSSMPPQLQRVLNQLRKQDVQCAWTAPNWARCDVILREVTQLVTVCRGHLPDRFEREPTRSLFPKAKRDEDGERLRVQGAWAPRRLFRWVQYDAVNFEEFTANDQLRIRPLRRQWYWRPVHVAQFVYDTSEAVQLMNHLDDVGTCIGCGGNRARPKCSCSFDADVHDTAGPPKAAGRGARPSPRILTGTGS